MPLHFRGIWNKVGAIFREFYGWLFWRILLWDMCFFVACRVYAEPKRSEIRPFRESRMQLGPFLESCMGGSFGASFFGRKLFAAWRQRVRQRRTEFSNPLPTVFEIPPSTHGPICAWATPSELRICTAGGGYKQS